MPGVSKSITKRIAPFAAAAVLCAGCTMFDSEKSRDESFREAAHYDRSSTSPTSKPWGYSSRSRDIERDLGVR